MISTPSRIVPILSLWCILFVGTIPSLGQIAPTRAGGTATIAAQKQQIRRQAAAFAATAAPAASQLDEKRSYVWEGDDWSPDTRTMYVYDATGRLAAWTYVWDGTGWVSESVTKTTPGPKGYSLILEEVYDAPTATWHPVDRIETDYLYNPGSGESFVNWTLYQSWDGEHWINVERDLFTYDGSLSVNSTTTEVWDGNYWAPESRFLITAENSDVFMTQQEWDGTTWTDAYRTIYRNWTIADLQREFAKLGDLIDDYEDVLYGLHLLPAAEAQEWDGTQWVNESRQVRTYDFSTGDVLEYVTEAWDENAWVPTSRLFMTYEAPTVVSAMSFDFYADGSWMTFTTETYDRDDQGFIVEAVQQSDLGEGLVNTGRVLFAWSHEGTASENEKPLGFALHPAYPNPFNPETHVSYRLGSAGHVGVRVYDALGRLVATLVDGMLPAGEYEVTFHAANLPSGQYIVRLDAPGFSQARVVTLLK